LCRAPPPYGAPDAAHSLRGSTSGAPERRRGGRDPLLEFQAGRGGARPARGCRSGEHNLDGVGVDEHEMRRGEVTSSHPASPRARAQPSSPKTPPSSVSPEPSSRVVFGSCEPGSLAGQDRKHASLHPTSAGLWGATLNAVHAAVSLQHEPAETPAALAGAVPSSQGNDQVKAYRVEMRTVRSQSDGWNRPRGWTATLARPAAGRQGSRDSVRDICARPGLKCPFTAAHGLKCRQNQLAQGAWRRRCGARRP
jgi:hypothetical protein